MNLPLRKFGKTGLDVSALGFGCMRFPVIDGDVSKINKPEATAMIHKAIDAGLNYLDTAYPYHGSNFPQAGESEPFVREALQGGYREKVNLVTKLPLWNVQTRDDMDRLLDEQLGRLGVDRFDVYLAHNFNANSWPRMKKLDIFSFLDKVVNEGRARTVGFSFHDNYGMFEEIMNSYDWPVVQLQYNYLDVNYQAGQRGVRLAKEKGAAVVIMEPLRGGFLINRIPAELQAMLREVRPEWSLADWALRWLWSQPEVDIVLSGMSTMEQVEENLRIAASPPDFGARETEALEQVRQWFADRLKVDCTACGYCLPCPKGVSIPKIFGYYNEFHMADDPEIRRRGRMFYASTVTESERADNCVKCRICEKRCPQGIEISRHMPQAALDLAEEVAK